MKIAVFIFLVCLLILTPLRIWEYQNIIDPVTGFYNEPNISNYIILGGIILCFLLIIIFVSRGAVMERPLRNGANGLGIGFILVGMVILAIYLNNLLPQLREFEKISKFSLALTSISIITGVVFVVIGMKFLLHSTDDTLMRFLMVIPIFWAISMLWRTFMGHQTIRSVSEHLFDIVSYIAVALGFLYLAYIVSGFGAIKHQKQMVIFGLMGSLLCLINASSKIYSQIFIKKNANYALMELGYFLDLFVGLLLLTSTIYLCFGVDDKKTNKRYRHKV